MSSRGKSTAVKVAVLIAAGVMWFIFVSPRLYFAERSTSTTYLFNHPDVSIEFERDGVQRVRLDGEEVLVPKGEAQSHPIAKEAWRRIIERGQPRVAEARLRWGRLVRLWLLPMVLLYFVVFRLVAKGAGVFYGTQGVTVQLAMRIN